jgi:plasmid stabilization system protein ParE
MNVVFVPEARDEFLDAIAYYEEARCGLGERFKGEIDRCILWIAGHNELYRIRPSGYQRINLRTFPYHIAFITRNSTLWVLAVAHNSRRPEYWITRQKEMG